jgi:hypothetical protein
MNAAKNIYVPKHLKKWTLPDSYIGATHEESYVFLGQHRDSDVLTRSNFEVALERLGGESDSVQVIHEGHWAVGWVEWISIDSSDEKALKLADDMMSDLDSYPVLDDDAFSEKEHNENYEYLDSSMKYFLSNLCEELELDEDKLSKNAKKTLEQFIEAAFMYEASYSGEAYFSVDVLKKRLERINEYSDYYRTMKGASKKMIKLLDAKFA